MKTVILELTYSDEVNADTVSALIDAHMDDEGLVSIRGRMANAAMEQRISSDDPEADEQPKCNCPLNGDPYKAPEQHAPTCPIYRLAFPD